VGVDDLEQDVAVAVPEVLVRPGAGAQERRVPPGVERDLPVLDPAVVVDAGESVADVGPGRRRRGVQERVELAVRVAGRAGGERDDQHRADGDHGQGEARRRR
jgi:hypothetical protein